MTMTRQIFCFSLWLTTLALSGCSLIERKPIAETPEAAKNTAYYFCGGCHGPPPVDHMVTMAPKIAGQKEGYLIKALKEYRDKKRINPHMNGWTWNVTDQGIANLAAYYAHLKPADPTPIMDYIK